MIQLRTIGTAISLLLLVVVSHATTCAAKPNVLFIAVDDLRPTLGCYGDIHAKTPSIDRLASEGLTFARAYCQQAVCSPSRTSIITGLRPDSTKVWDLFTHFRDTVPDVVTMPQHFKAHGYHTESIGKIMHKPHMQDDERSWSVPSRRGRGSHWHTAENLELLKRLKTEADEKGLTGKARYYTTLSSPTDDADVPDSDHADGNTAGMAVETLQRLSKQGEPFFLAVGFVKPHLLFSAPQKYWDLYDPNQLPRAKLDDYPAGAPKHAHTHWGELRHYAGMPQKGPVSTAQAKRLVHGYYACTSFADAQIGRVLQQLRELKLADNTIVVLWGDHGWKLGDYGAWCKHTAFEIDARVPLILRSPQHVGGKQTSALAELVDIYPTLCDLAELPRPTHLEGGSLAPLLEDPQQAWEDVAISQWPGKSKGVMGYSIRTNDWRYTEWVARHDGQPNEVVARELYDHRESRLGETINIVDQEQHKTTVDELASRLHERVSSTREESQTAPQ